MVHPPEDSSPEAKPVRPGGAPRKPPRSGRRAERGSGGHEPNPARDVAPASASPRWHVHVELDLEQMSELHRRGLSSGALAWRPGMGEWRPLAVLNELRRAAAATAARIMDSGNRAAARGAARGSVPPPPSSRTVKPGEAPGPRTDSTRPPPPPGRARPASVPPPAARATAKAAAAAPDANRNQARAAQTELLLPAFGRETPSVVAAGAQPRTAAASAPARARASEWLRAMLHGNRLWLASAALVCVAFGWLLSLPFWRQNDDEAVSETMRWTTTVTSASNCLPPRPGSGKPGESTPADVAPVVAAAGAAVAAGVAPRTAGGVTVTPAPSAPSVPVVNVEQLGSESSLPVVSVEQLSSESALAPGTGAEPRGQALKKSRKARAARIHLADSPTPRHARGVPEEDAPTPSVSIPEAPERATVVRALDRAARAAASCNAKEKGSAVVVITFAPSGGVRAVRFEQSPNDPEVASCVMRAMGRAKVPQFSGEPMTVKKTVHF